MTTRVLTRRAALIALGALAACPDDRACAGARARDVPRRAGRRRSPARQRRRSDRRLGGERHAGCARAGPRTASRAGRPQRRDADRASGDDLSLPEFRADPARSGPAQDTIEGDLIVKGPHGGVVSETPLRAITSYFPKPVDQPLWVESNHNRIDLLAQAFAGWVPRQLGL